jgi:hypothetical protein
MTLSCRTIQPIKSGDMIGDATADFILRVVLRFTLSTLQNCFDVEGLHGENNDGVALLMPISHSS